MKPSPFLRFILPFLFILVLTVPSLAEEKTPRKPSLAELKARIEAVKPDPRYPDDPFALAAVKEAYAALIGGSGGVGACLVNERTGAIIERGRNRQFNPYFRSDLHAEMDLLDRYEDRLKKSPPSKGGNPRDCTGLVLYSSLEPCPMCLTRIINSGIPKTYYAAPDPQGGMASRLENMPPFWRSFAQNRMFAPARCSPEISTLAADLFNYSMRNFKGKEDASSSATPATP